jgi:hypothetical protein
MNTSHDDLIDRSAYIHWPDGFDPDNAELFAHNAVVIDAPPRASGPSWRQPRRM